MAQEDVSQIDVLAVTGTVAQSQGVAQIDVFAIVNNNPPPPPPPPARRAGSVDVIVYRLTT